MIVLTTTRTLRDLRDQIVAMRLRHDDEIRSVLRLVPAEDAIRWSIDRTKRALAESRDREPEAAQTTERAETSDA